MRVFRNRKIYNTLTMLRFIAIAILGSLFAACSNLAPTTPVATAGDNGADDGKEKIAERPFPPESVYPLLVAEFALRRRDYDVALKTYLEQAEALREPAISAHATHLAQFMRREEEALQAVQLWLELEPDNIEANNTVATLLAKRGRTLEAVPHFAVVARSGSEVHFPLLLNGFDKLDPADQARLVAAINDLAVEFPEDAGLLLSQAILYEELGEDDLALEKLALVFSREPYQHQALIMEARLLLERDAELPLQRIEAALLADPDATQLRLQYARLLTRSSMVAARQQFELLSAKAPGNSDLLFSLALINRETGNNAEAKAYLYQMLERKHRVGEAHYYLGRILEDQGDLKSAVSHYMEVEDGRDFLSANSHIGGILLATQQEEQNHAYLNDLRQKYPKRKEQLYGLEAEMLTRSGDLEGAMRVLNTALIDMPESTTLRYTRSMLGEHQNDLALMEQDLRAILDREPDNVTALNALGYTLANRTERYSEAFSLISRALELDPEEPAILDSMGWILYRQGKYAQAVDYLSKAFAKFPDPEVAAHLGEVLWISGDKARALLVLQGAIAKDPDHEILVDTMTRLGVPSSAE